MFGFTMSNQVNDGFAKRHLYRRPNALTKRQSVSQAQLTALDQE